jgi:hypothetical protein
MLEGAAVAVAVILSVRLQSGAFEASVSVPIKPDGSTDDFKSGVERWLALTFQALQHGVSEMNATLTATPPSAGDGNG